MLVLLAAAGVAWFSTAERMAGMDAAPGTDLGALGWFTGAWAVMMAPSLAPTAAIYASLTRRRETRRSLLFAGGYLLVWSVADVAVYGLFGLGQRLMANDLKWDEGWQWLAVALLVAARYELTPLKHACLLMCRARCDS
jgi:predicted metal-binding membrane protein